jgi:Sulphur transport
MGVGGTLAAGCNIGNALTGLSVLAVNNAIATVAIVAGAAVAIGSAGIPGRIPGLHLVRGQR